MSLPLRQNFILLPRERLAGLIVSYAAEQSHPCQCPFSQPNLNKELESQRAQPNRTANTAVTGKI